MKMKHDDYLDAFKPSCYITESPVWYVELNGEIHGVIQLDEAGTMEYKKEAKNYPDCRVWCYVMFGWAYMNVNNIQASIWTPANPPEVVLLAHLIGDSK